MNIEVVQGAPQRVSVQVAGPVEVEVDSPETRIDVGGFLPNQNLFVSDTQPGFSAPGLWIQTGLGPNGEDFTFWIEDGE